MACTFVSDMSSFLYCFVRVHSTGMKPFIVSLHCLELSAMLLCVFALRACSWLTEPVQWRGLSPRG